MTGNLQYARVRGARDLSTERLATALGWFGIGLGLAELTAPRTMARLIGVDGDGTKSDRVLRGFGVREIVSGLGIVRSERPTTWMWSRVAGDLMDLAYLGSSYRDRRSTRSRVSAAAAVTVLTGRRAATRCGARCRRCMEIERPKGRPGDRRDLVLAARLDQDQRPLRAGQNPIP